MHYKLQRNNMKETFFVFEIGRSSLESDIEIIVHKMQFETAVTWISLVD